MQDINKDAFSSGQIGSKIWLCSELEKLNLKSQMTYIYGGWYGITAFLLLSRQIFDVTKIRSFDIDPACEKIADMLNENWVFNDWQFKAMTEDCNLIDPANNADLIINTSSEHFENMQWWDNIPTGTNIIVQGNNMPHDDHHIHTDSLEQFKSKYPVTEEYFSGSLDFVYPTWEFTRYMLIGRK